MDLLLSWPGLVSALVLVAAGAIQGSTGFGFNMLAAPVLAIMIPSFVPGAMITLAMVVSIGGALVEHSDIHRRDLLAALSGRLVAVMAAALVLGMLAPEAFAAIFGLGVLLAVGLSLSGWHVRPSARNLFIAGATSGFMGTLTSIGAPPMALVYQNTGGARMRATLNAFFVLGSLMSVGALIWAGRYGLRDLALAATMLPFAFLGFLFSGWGRRMMDKGQVRLVILTVSTLSAIVLLARAFGFTG
ncbi:sulfite exporter TauE/SafE family protein [Paracoccus suum]|uniref:Probable membrane transporter protein n=1 Tax=Paracoccus suum TaxID=2259340 RepID=A0A344PPJ4_9RHOB|nr:sulfite exporter TauE/SafE family protein [Paracoccus suum]